MDNYDDIEQERLTAIDKKRMGHAAYTQGVFILAQTIFFPELGLFGAIIAALCGVMPWAIPMWKQSHLKAQSLMASSLVIALFYGALCSWAVPQLIANSPF